MASFLASCACRGARPKKVNLKNKYVREHLISRLMSQRSVLRFIKAPNGFGKSTLAAQYADLVFSFKNVFWIDCKSPCFIRDLDSNDLVNQIVQLCDKPKLVIFDNYENIDDERCEIFTQVIDNLLQLNCEIIVCACPYNDSILKFQADAYVIDANDLLLTDEELSNMNVSAINRIPILAWNEDEQVSQLLKCAVNEKFPSAIIFSLFIIYLFQEGSLDLLYKYLKKSELKLLIDIDKEYIYFGIDENKNSFSVPYIFTSKLISLFNSEMQTLINVMQCTDRSGLAEKLCSLLAEYNKNDICMNVAACIGDNSLRKTILIRLNEDSIRNMYLKSANNLFNQIPENRMNDGLLTSFNSLRLAILGNINEAVRYSYGVLDSKYSTIDNKLLSALIFLRFGNIHEIEQSLKIIRHLNNDFKIDSFLNNLKLSDEEKFKCSVINRLTEIAFAIHSNSKNPYEVWNSEAGDALSDEDIISGELLFHSTNYIQIKYINSAAFNIFIGKLSRYFNLAEKIDFNFYTFALIDSYLNEIDELENLCDAQLWRINEDLNKKYLIFKRRFNLELGINMSNEEHSSNHIKQGKDIDLIHQGFSSIRNDVPKLKINVLGGLSAFIGDREIISTNFGRQSIKLICCILAIENGNEIAKMELAKIIWPDCDEVCRRTNINTHWSVFRKLFVLENGECPYFIKNQNSYKLSQNHFESDLQSLERICSDLTLGALDSTAWWEEISKNEKVITGSLLPSETENLYIKQKRIELRNKVVDALVAASERLIDAGEIQQALWFAHKAHARDKTREDVYISLMRAQYEAGQRTPAIETYFACKKFLDEELGIGPSKRISLLYSRVVKETGVETP